MERIATALTGACASGTADDVRHILADPSTNPVADNWILDSLVSLGRAEIIKILLADGRMDPMFEGGSALYRAMRLYKNDCVYAFYADPRVDFANINISIVWAAERNELNMVERLLLDPRIDPSVAENGAIREAARNGNIAVVKRLLKDRRVDPSACDNFALSAASFKKYREIEVLLLADPRVMRLYAMHRAEEDD